MRKMLITYRVKKSCNYKGVRIKLTSDLSSPITECYSKQYPQSSGGKLFLVYNSTTRKTSSQQE